ncbi:ferredoxin family protein [Uliginosibacterium sp. H1]|uniref:ferredoxin family protein n=1 Tax=Uliginosibacterium sp. H1 TaxID=3114757 RepID=UPI002E16E9E4|nr:ferredoxin family protein [Uliginosibacterium sp. H1]
MIEFIDAEACTQCDRCVPICPDLVFDAVPGGIPALARREDCQTCYLCELYCPVDAIYVSPRREPETQLDRQHIIDTGLLGSYRRAMGWKPGKPGSMDSDLSYRMHEDFPGGLGDTWKRSGVAGKS